MTSNPPTPAARALYKEQKKKKTFYSLLIGVMVLGLGRAGNRPVHVTEYALCDVDRAGRADQGHALSSVRACGDVA
jgi:hypothetical protein